MRSIRTKYDLSYMLRTVLNAALNNLTTEQIVDVVERELKDFKKESEVYNNG